MAWIQIREVALAIDLFGESCWVCPVTYVPVLIPPEEEDIRLAFAEPEIKLSTDFNDDRRLIESADDYAFTDEYIQSNNSIQSLIQAAVEYFFSSKKSSLSSYDPNSTVDTQIDLGSRDRQLDQKLNKTKNIAGQVRSRRFTKPSRHQSLKLLTSHQSNRDKLLSVSQTAELHNQGKSQVKNKQTSSSTNRILPKTRARNFNHSVNQLSQRLKQLIQTPVRATTKTKTTSAISPSKTTKPIAANTQLKPVADYVETAATPQGYAKNPLEKFVAWLDRMFLRLEKAIARIWQKLKR
jgi:hypothetical protein